MVKGLEYVGGLCCGNKKKQTGGGGVSDEDEKRSGKSVGVEEDKQV